MADRKELIREYKRTPIDMGVYQVRNTVNGKCFVGVSKNIRARLNRHRSDLKFGGESVKAMLEDYRQYGAEAFAFETLDLLEPSDKPGYKPDQDLQVLESLWLEKLQPFEPQGYNKAK